ncbi:MAG: hypothetical protein KF749_16125 [Bacteroidetes bacterium]|nr:hypothetical protein [Bacteroidota bacterium]MCW5896638.1 hypothetical protein [Bacteroidota bacterium]
MPASADISVRYALPKPSQVTLTVFGMLGNEVRTITREHQEAGFHFARWDCRNKQGIEVTDSEFILRIMAEATDGSEVFISARKFVLKRVSTMRALL